MELTSQHLIVAALWIIWCFVPSLMIAPVVTDRLKDKFGDHFRFYRLFFNTVALVTFSTGVFAIAGGCAALNRRHFVLAVVGAVDALLVTSEVCCQTTGDGPASSWMTREVAPVLHPTDDVRDNACDDKPARGKEGTYEEILHAG